MSLSYEFQHRVKTLSGHHSLEQLPKELHDLGVTRPLVISDEMLKKIGILQMVLDVLEKEGEKEIPCFTGVPVDSSSDVVNEIGRVYRKLGCDGLVAVGGGSVIDTAKGVKMLLSQEANDLLELVGCETIKRGIKIPFVVIPTTSGTGSETTLVAVIKHVSKKVKMEFISYHLQPDVAILDSRMTKTLPPKITASTGMDTLCHAIEAYTCLQKNPISDAYATAAIVLIRDNLYKAVVNGNNKKVRLAMANASTMAGAAFSNSMVGLVHAIGHALGGECHIPHGDAMNILLPYVMRYNQSVLDEQYGELLIYFAGADVYAVTPKQERGKRMIQEVRKLQKRLYHCCGLPLTLGEIHPDPIDFELVARKAMNDGAILVNPKKAEKKDIIHILEAAYGKEDAQINRIGIISRKILEIADGKKGGRL